jgi:hypothetical protein
MYYLSKFENSDVKIRFVDCMLVYFELHMLD